MESHGASSSVTKASVSEGVMMKGFRSREKERLRALVGLLYLCSLFIALGSPSSLFSCGQLLLELVHSC